MPSISICIPTHNRADILADRLRRLSAMQGRLELEVALSDNASTDHTREVAAQFAKEFARFHYIRQPKLLNVTLNFYAALRMARGDYIIQTGDDDTIVEETVRAFSERMEENPGITAMVGNSRVYDYEKEQELGIIHFVREPESFAFEQAEELFRRYYFLEYMMIRRSVLHRYYHNEGLSYPTGWRLMFVCLKRGTVEFSTEPLVLKGESRTQYGYRNYVAEIQDYPRADPEYFAALTMPFHWKDKRESIRTTALMRSVRYSADSTINANMHEKRLVAWHHAQKGSLYDYNMSEYPHIPFETLVFSRVAEWIATRITPGIQRIVVEESAGARQLEEYLKKKTQKAIEFAALNALQFDGRSLLVSLRPDARLLALAAEMPGFPYMALEDSLPACCDRPEMLEQARGLLWQSAVERAA